MKKVLVATSIIEGSAGILLILVTSMPSALIFGADALDNVALTILRIAAIALISLSIACFLSRNSDTAITILKAMLFYHIMVITVFVYGKFYLHINRNGLLPAAAVHLIPGIWSMKSIKIKSIQNNLDIKTKM